jgi:hypothetical protein
MAQANSSNANRYKGEDIDTDGDGSVNDSQTVQGNQPSDLGNTVDGVTVIKNSNDDLQAVSKKILADFENNASGDWSKNNFAVIDNEGGAENSTFYFSAYGLSSQTVSDSRIADLSDADTLILYLKFDPSEGGSNGTSNDDLNFYINSNLEASLSGGSSTNWRQFEVDISSYGSGATLKIEFDKSSSTFTRVGFDRCYISGVSSTTNSGAGGTT